MKVGGLDAPRPEPRPLRGIVLMVCAVTLFSVMDSGAKYLSERYPVLLVVWARFFFNVLIMLVVLGPVLGLDLVRTRRPVLQLVRGLALGCSSVLFVSALPWMRLADASAVTFVTPMLVTLGAICLYRHKAPSGTWLALVVSFLGVLMVFGVSLVVLGFASSFLWVVLLLVLVNSMGSVSDVLSQSLIQLRAPRGQRGLAGGAWVVAIGTAPLGQLQIGALASLFGVSAALGVHGLALLVLAAAGALWFPRLRRL